MIPVIWTDNFRPSQSRLYQKAMFQTAVTDAKPSVPRVAVVQRRIAIDEEHLNRYQQITHNPISTHLPPLYLQVYSLPVQLFLLTHEQCGVKVMGLVHLSNEVSQFRRVAAHENIELINHFEPVGVHKRGWLINIVTCAYVDGELVYKARATSLAVAKHEQTASWQNMSPEGSLDQREFWQLDAALGRNYAKISGDYNPIHLYPLTARMFGFKRQIAHGMWSKARALSAFTPEMDMFHCRVDFKRPVFLPSQVKFMVSEGQQTQGFALYSTKDAPHLVGNISPKIPPQVSGTLVYCPGWSGGDPA